MSWIGKIYCIGEQLTPRDIHVDACLSLRITITLFFISIGNLECVTNYRL